MVAVSTSETETETLIHEYSKPRPVKCVFLRPRPGKQSRPRLLHTIWNKLELLGPKQ